MDRPRQWAGVAMKFALLYNTDYHQEVHGSPARYYGEILDQVCLAEDLGFEAAWFGEHHYQGYSFGAPAELVRAYPALAQDVTVRNPTLF